MEGAGRGCHCFIDRSRGMGLLLVLITVMMSVRGIAAEVHHTVGGYRGWDIASDISAWSADRLFRVGDTIWFAYSTEAGESIVEVGSREELEACDVTNPIRMYTDGLDSITLDGIGTRFFASGSSDSCRKGLKLDVNVLPKQPTQQVHDQMKPITTTIPPYEFADAVAAGPTTPSAAVPLQGSFSSSNIPFLALLLGFLLL